MYKASKYNNLIDCQDYSVLFNSFTGLNKARKVLPEDIGIINALGRGDFHIFTREQIGELVECGFLIPSNCDEFAKVRFAYNERVNSSFLSVTGLGTTSCSFTCSYCYE